MGRLMIKWPYSSRGKRFLHACFTLGVLMPTTKNKLVRLQAFPRINCLYVPFTRVADKHLSENTFFIKLDSN